MAAGHRVERAANRALPRSSAAWPQGCTPHPEHLQEQQQGEQRVKSMLFHMSGEGALLTTCSQRRSPPGADVPIEWVCRHRAQPSSSHIPPPQGHLGAAAAFGKGRGWRDFPVNSRRLHCCCCSVLRDVADFDTPAEPFSEFCDPSHVWGRHGVCTVAAVFPI